MAKRKSRRPANVDRLLRGRWGSGRQAGDRLWDRGGRVWLPVDVELSDRDIESLFFDESVPVVISEGGSHRWLDLPRRDADWQRLSARLITAHPDLAEARTNPLPFEAQLWASEGDRLLLFDDHD